MVVTTAWALAVFVGVVVAAPYSGAHLNPAVTFAFALTGQFPWERVLPYVSAQMIGAALGAVLVWLAYRPHFEATPGPSDQAGRFLYGSGNSAHRLEFSHRADRDVLVAVHHLLHYSRRDHAVGRYLHVARWTGLGRRPAGRVHGLGDGLSLGGPTGYAINPAKTWRRALSMPCCRSEARAEATGAMRGFRSRHLCAARRWQRGFIICFCSRLPGCAAFSV